MNKMSMKLRVNTKNNINDNEEKGLLRLEDDLEQPLSPTTQYLMSDVATLYVLAFLELQIPVDFTSTLTFLNDVFIRIHPRLSSVVIDNNGTKMWKRVATKVEDHVKVPSFPKELTAENFNEDFDNYISKIATSQLPPNIPLWQLHIINCPKGHHAPAIFIFKFHHAIGDGTSLMAGVLSCIKRVDDPSLPLTFPIKMKTTSQNKNNNNAPINHIIMNMFKITIPKVLSSIIYSLYDFTQGVQLLFSEDSRTPIRSGNANMALPFSTRVCSLTLPLNHVKKIKTLLGVTINDIIVGIIFLGTRLYIQEIDPKQLKHARSTASVFVNIRNMNGNFNLDEMLKGNAWGNRISNIELPLPNLEDGDLKEPLKFIEKAHKVIKSKRNGIFGPYLMAKLLDVIRTFAGFQMAVRTFERRWSNCSFAITNIIGPSEQFSIANHPVKGFYFVPTGINLSLVVSVLSYMEELRLSLVVENGFIDHQRLITCIERAFQLIFEAAHQATPNHVAQ